MECQKRSSGVKLYLAVSMRLLVHHLTYDQTRYVAQEVRQALAIARPPTRHRVITRLSRAEAERFIAQAYRILGVRGLLIKTLFQTGTRESSWLSLPCDHIHAWTFNLKHIDVDIPRDP